MNHRIICIILFISLATHSFCQSRWTNVYYGQKNAYGHFFIESYDQGYLLLGRHGANNPHYSWLIKTDINGEILWEKTIGFPDYLFSLVQLVENQSGSNYIVGVTTKYDDDGDPIILKLDTCGEKQWCKVFHTQDNMDYSNLVETTDDGGCVSVLMYTGNSQGSNPDRICCVKLSEDGDILWRNCYNSQDTLISNQDADHIIMTNDKGFIISGICSYKSPGPPPISYNKPYFLKIDSNGVFQWETVAFKEMGALERGHGWTTTIDPSGQYYYSSISHYQYYPYSSSPAIIKMDKNGAIIDVYNIVDGFPYGGMAWAQFINDTLMAASAGWGNHIDSINQFAVLVDTLGNLIDSALLSNDIYGPKLQLATDNKLLYFFNTFQNSQFDVYLAKLNYDLEDDTFYTYPFQYDTLCPFPIGSDTISPDGCDIIVGIEENGIKRKSIKEMMELYPNPARDRINCRLSGVDCQCSIFILDLYARKQEEIQIPKGQKEVQIDVSDFPNGIYVAVLISKREILDRKKFVVR